MDLQEWFLQRYQDQVQKSLALPAELGKQFTPVSCLKNGERQVYLARDPAGQPAVLKIQPVGRANSLGQEFHLLCRLNHPQIPRPRSYQEADGREYLVREYNERSFLGFWGIHAL